MESGTADPPFAYIMFFFISILKEGILSLKYLKAVV